VPVLGWAQCERLAARVGDALREAVGPAVSELPFIALPRGGLFVLGLLSYVLDLRREQIRSLADPVSGRVVLVDDCALSGARLARALDELGSGPVLVAHLYSHPGLREAVESTDSRVERCLAAADLASRPGVPSAEELDPVWRPRLPGRRYWLGAVEPVAFPWSEPEVVWWNERDGRLEEGWHRVSPRSCLRFRAELGLPGPVDAPGPLDLAPGWLWKLEGERWLVRPDEPTGRILGFEGVALDMWRALLAFGDVERAAGHLLTLYDVEADELRADLDELVEDLVGRGLLVGTPARAVR